MAQPGPVVGLAGVWVDRRGQYVLHREPVGRGAAQLVGCRGVDNDLLARQREAEGHPVKQLAVAWATAVDDHSVRGSVERVKVNPLGHCNVPVVDVKGHRAAVCMGQTDAVAVHQLGLIFEALLAPVPAHGSSTCWPLGARWDGHE